MANKLKIAHFTQFLGIGGLEKIILELSLEQKNQGHEVTIVVYDYEQEWVQFFRDQGVRVITTFKKSEGFDSNLIPQFLNFIEQEKFSVIHTHDINPLLYLSLAKILGTIKGISFKLVHTAHTLDHVENSKKIEIFERIVAHVPNHVVAVSTKIQNFYLDKVLIPPERIHLIENGISQKNSPESIIKERKDKIIEEFKLSKNKPIGLCLSRIVPLKDQLFLIKIIKDIPEIQLLVVGPPSDPEYYEMIKLIIDQNPNQNIRLLGPRGDVIELNEISDFYVSASTHEGLPVSVLEAMSVGSPCLISNIVGHSNLNKYGEVVDLYQIGSETDFKLKLKSLVSNLSSSKYKRGKEIVEQNYSTKKMALQYYEIYIK